MRLTFAVLALAAVTACASPEELLENSIREELSKQGDVDEVDMEEDGDDRLTGFATMRNGEGDVRFDCEARRKGGDEYDWTCNQQINEAMLNRIESSIRTEFTSRGLAVTQVELEKDGRDRMAGFAEVRDPSGGGGRLTCSADRNEDNGANFDWKCEPPAA